MPVFSRLLLMGTLAFGPLANAGLFEPRLAPDEKPTLGGRTSAGAELNVWVKVDGFSGERTAFVC